MFSSLFGQNVSVKLVLADTAAFYALGDTITVNIEINAATTEITGYDIYMTFDPVVFRPIFPSLDDSLANKPFSVGSYFEPKLFYNYGIFQNDTHGDIWNVPYVDVNTFADFQLDFVQLTGPDLGGGRPKRSGKGIAASVKLKVVAIPLSGTSGLTIDDHNDNRTTGPDIHHRRTRFHTGGAGITFTGATGLTFDISGVSITPPLPDTVVTPGSSLGIYLGEHFRSALFDSSQTAWSEVGSYPTRHVPTGTTFSFTPRLGGPNPTTELQVFTNASDHDSLTLLIQVQDTAGTYMDTQPWRVMVDHQPVFDVALPAFTTDEDATLTLSSGLIFTDLDDSGANLTVWLEPDSLIHLTYDAAGNNLSFRADTNWFSPNVQKRRLYIRDSLGETADSLLDFTVNAVNDTPSINLDTLAGALRDTLITHRGVTDNIDLSLYTADVDDDVLVYSTDDPSPTDLTLIPSGSGAMLVTAALNAAFGNYPVIITATDSSGASDSDTLVVSIRSWPPVIDSLIADIIIVAGNLDTVSLSPLVTDLDTDNLVMSWSFEVRDFMLDTLDIAVDVSNYDSVNQQLEIVTTAGYAAQDRLIFYVQDDDGNRDTSFARLAIFSTLNPAIFAIPIDTVFMDRTTAVLDLDDFVIDPRYTPAQMTWTSSGGDRLLGHTIDSTSHVLTVMTNDAFYGWDTLTFVVENPDTLTDTSTVILRVIPEVDDFPIWSSFDEIEVVYPDTADIGFLLDFVGDDFTDDQDLIMGVYPNPDVTKPLNVIIDSTTWEIKVSPTSAQEYQTWVFFTAEDVAGQLTVSDTVWISVRDSYSPVWINVPNRVLGLNETLTDTLSKYLSDRDTPISNITITNVANRTDVAVTYDPATTLITYSSNTIESVVDITYTAVDDSNNMAVTSNTIIVRIPADNTAPEALSTYYFHPVQKKRIEYVIIGDSTTARLNSIYIFNDRERPLDMVQKDSSGATFTWYGQDKMELSGIYQLISEVNDLRNNVNRMSLTLALDFSKKMGGQIISGNGKLSASYPATDVPEGHLIIVSNSSSGPAGGVGLSKQSAETGYSLDTNLPDELLMTVRYDQQGNDGYYAFYDVTDGSRLRVPTYKAGPDTYEAYVSTGRTVVFDESAVKAGDAIPETASLWTHPNPFNATLQMRFMLRLPDRGQVRIYNLLGQEVFSTVKTDYAPGIHSIAWHGSDQQGRKVSSGIYFVQLTTERGLTQLRKVTLLK